MKNQNGYAVRSRVHDFLLGEFKSKGTYQTCYEHILIVNCINHMTPEQKQQAVEIVEGMDDGS